MILFLNNIITGTVTIVISFLVSLRDYLVCFFRDIGQGQHPSMSPSRLAIPRSPSNTPSSSCDFVIPFCPFECTLLNGIKAKYSSLLDPAIQRCSLLEEGILSRGASGPDLLRSLSKTIVSLSDLHIRALEESDSDIDSEDNIDVNSPSLATSLKTYLFQGWRFAQKTGELVLLSQTQYALEEHNGDHAQSYISIISSLQNIKEELFRLKSLEQQNADVCNKLTCDPPPKLIVVPAYSDNSLWDLVLGMYLVGHRTQLQNVGKKTGLLSDFTYGIWQVAQQFSLACRRPANGGLVETWKHLFPLLKLRKPAKPLLSNHNHKPPIIHLETLLNIPTYEAELPVPMSVFPPDSDRPARSSLHDPRAYVEIIPWMELEPVSPTVLKEAHIPIFLPRRTAMAQGLEASLADVKWMLWKPPSSNFFDCHHLFTEDEVYQYCVESDWHFPGHFYRDHVVFALSPLNASRFVDDLENFWDTWVCELWIPPCIKSWIQNFQCIERLRSHH